MAFPYTLERPAERLGGAGSTPAKATNLRAAHGSSGFVIVDSLTKTVVQFHGCPKFTGMKVK